MRLIVTLLAGCTLLLSACGDYTDKPAKASGSVTLTDTGATGDFQSGRNAVLIFAGVDSCDQTAATSWVQGAVTPITNTTGPVTLNFSIKSDEAVLETFYVDVDASSSLTTGDQVLGTVSSGALTGYCYDSAGNLPFSQTLDWGTTLTTDFGGRTAWAGGTQAF